MTLPARIPAKPKREKRWRSYAHLAFVRSFSCAMCGSQASIEAAHVRIGSNAGLGQKPDDWRAVPLCSGIYARDDGRVGCHQVQHGKGERSFWYQYAQEHGQTVEQLIAEFIEASPKRAEIKRVMKEREQ